MTTNIVLTGVGRDRVGIVAELSQVLFEFGCNLLDSSMTLLRGEFAVILMAQLPETHTLIQLRERLNQAEAALGMQVFVRELSDASLDEDDDEGHPYIISVYGGDRPGIVAGITKALQTLSINITDVATKRTRSEQSIFMMVLEVTAPITITESELRQSLNKVSAQLGVDVSIQSLEVVEL
ncbi:MAG: ACT domain-containing protein [Candidatus Melainabacteria bacterium]|nr:ACT domain-containing protein [Candidatus Melainabacteria bacterium]